MDKAKKRLASAFDGLRNLNSAPKVELDVKEALGTADFHLANVVRHGFPHNPKCMAYDPVQRLLAIGTGCGAIRLFGRPGVDCQLKHESDAAVNHLQFLVNEGALVSVCRDDAIHLWNFRQKRPEIVHSLQFQKDQITCLHVPFQSKWLYLGTEKGNVWFVSIAKFELSGYCLYWNKVNLSDRTHPGQVRHLSDCPGSDNNLLCGFERGTVVLWDLRNRTVLQRFLCEQLLNSISWHYDGRQFVCALGDGSLCTWDVERPQQATRRWTPHARAEQDAADAPAERCRPISQVEWLHPRSAKDDVHVFAGGLPLDEDGALPAVSVLRGRQATTVLEMEHPIIAFQTLCASPYPNEPQEPFAVAVLLRTDFLIVDLTTPGYPVFENPYPMDIHESAVTCCSYLTDCPTDLVAAFYSVGTKQKQQGCSDKTWPISGGEWGSSATGNQEIIITGHADGSIKFWDASSEQLHALYKLKAGRHFERPAAGSLPADMEPQAIDHMALCPESRAFVVAGRAAQVTYFRFVQQECAAEIPVLEVPIVYSTGDDAPVDDAPPPPRSPAGGGSASELKRQSSVESNESGSSSTSEGTDLLMPLKVRGGPLKRPAGYQPELVCITLWQSANAPETVRSLALNSAYGLMAYGTDQGLAVIDIVQHVPVLTMGTPDLYGPSDPYTRLPQAQLSNASDGSDRRGDSVDVDALPSPSADRMPSELLSPARRKNPFTFVGDGFPLADFVEASAETEDGPPPTHVNNLARPYRLDRSVSATAAPTRPARRTKVAHVAFGSAPTTCHASAEALPIAAVDRLLVEDAHAKSGVGRLRSLPLNPASTAGDDTPPENGESGQNECSAEPPPPPPPDENCAKGVASPSVRRAQSSKPMQKPALKDIVRRFSSRHAAGRVKPRRKRPPTITKNSRCSRSSSVSSQDPVTREAVTVLFFIETYVRRSDTSPSACLLVGTSMGSCLPLSITMPNDERLSNAVFAAPTGASFRVKGCVLRLALLDPTFSLLAPPVDSWKKASRDAADRSSKNRLVARSRVVVTQQTSEAAPVAVGGGDEAAQYAVAVGERQAKVVALPAFATLFSLKLSDASLAMADVLTVRSSPVVAAIATTGQLLVYALPSLRQLFDCSLLTNFHSCLLPTTCFGDYGHGLYMCSPSEVQKFTVCAETAAQLGEVLGELFLGCDMPEPVRKSFLKELFGGASQSLDREELFGESSGKASRTVARHIPGPSAMDPVRAQGASASGEVGRARLVLNERGEKLSEVEERTQMLMENSKAYGDAASQLANKMKNKKWYQL